jgi:hypothetical protein
MIKYLKCFVASMINLTVQIFQNKITMKVNEISISKGIPL